MKIRAIVAIFVVFALLAGCKSNTEKQNRDLQATVEALSAKVATLEADNGRLKEQIRLLTIAADSLSGAMKVQQALGTQPAASPIPSPAAK